jgi:signal transduction histidine kinase
MARMRPLIDAKFTEMQGTIDLSHRGQQGQAVEIVAAGDGKVLTDKIIEEMRVIAVEETTRHERALDSARDRSTMSLIAVSLLGVFVLGGLFILFRALRRRGVEEGLRRLSEEKDEFLGMVSHELRTPITVILGNARVLKQKWEALPADARDTALTDIEDHANRMHGVVANMLRLSRPEHQAEVELEPVHVVRLVERSINRHYARYPRPAVRLDAAGGIPPALAHEEYLGQVVENLLSNAAKYGSRTEPIDVEVIAANGVVAISVMDRGPGIARRRRDTIFEPFVRLPDSKQRGEGLGLGLPICRLLMRTLGGDVTVSDRPGGGSRFTATLQAAPVPQEEAETAAQAELVAAD